MPQPPMKDSCTSTFAHRVVALMLQVCVVLPLTLRNCTPSGMGRAIIPAAGTSTRCVVRAHHEYCVPPSWLSRVASTSILYIHDCRSSLSPCRMWEGGAAAGMIRLPLNQGPCLGCCGYAAVSSATKMRPQLTLPRLLGVVSCVQFHDGPQRHH